LHQMSLIKLKPPKHVMVCVRTQHALAGRLEWTGG
jgi:hypothetical protein